MTSLPVSVLVLGISIVRSQSIGYWVLGAELGIVLTLTIRKGLIFGPLLFIIFINDLVDIFTDNIKMLFCWWCKDVLWGLKIQRCWWWWGVTSERYIECAFKEAFECSSAVAQLKFSRQRVPDGRSRDTESSSCQISVGSRDDHLWSIGWPQCLCWHTNVHQDTEVRRHCCGPHLVVCQCYLVCDPLPHCF